MSEEKLPIASRFRGYLPVVLDLETGGFNPKTDALLESAVCILQMDEAGNLVPGEKLSFNIEPFEGANLEPAALKVTGIDPHHPFRKAIAVPEEEALGDTFRAIRAEIRRTGCTRAIVVAHNAFFDHSFIMAAAERCSIKRNPFHPFSTFDTATLCGLAYGQTVLSRACEAAGITFETDQAHSAIYDCDVTTELFCRIVNRWRLLDDLG